MKVKIYKNEALTIGAVFTNDALAVSVEVDAALVIGPAVPPESFSQTITVNEGTDVAVTDGDEPAVVTPVEETPVDPAVDAPVEATDAPVDVPQKPADEAKAPTDQPV